MRFIGRISLGMLGVAGFAGLAQAQAIKQLPADPMMIVKVNNPDAVNGRASKMMQQLGLAAIMPDLVDPLGAAKAALGIKDGMDGKGDMAMGFYFEPANPNDMKGLIVLSVTDYKKFTGNFAMLKDEGDGVSSFVLNEGGDSLYVSSRGTYAAISNEKAILTKPAGAVVSSAAAMTQLDKADVVFYANTQKLAEQGLPQIKQARPMALQEIERGLNAEPTFDKKFVPVVKELANQGFNFVEDVLSDTTAATVAMNITDKGIVFTTIADFKATGKIGSTVAKIKNTNVELVSGIPVRKYFATFGLAMDYKPLVDFASNYLDPVSKEVEKTGADGKKYLDLYANLKKGMLAVKSISAGMVQPTGQPGQQSVLQEVAVTRGDVAVIKETQDKVTQGSMDISNMIQDAVNSGMKIDIKIEKGAAKIGGGTFDKFTTKYIVDPANPAAQQAKQTIDLMYGPNGLSGIQGGLDANNFIVAMGGDDKLSEDLVASAKANSNAVAQSKMVQASASMLPAQKIAVMYVHPENIATTVVAYLSSMGMRVPFKMQADTSPMGISISTEGAALRMDAALPNDLIESIVVSIKQVTANAVGGGM